MESISKKIYMSAIIISFTSMLFFLSACSRNNVSVLYEGKSQNWSVVYSIVGNQATHESSYSFTYLGDDVKHLDDVRYSIDGPREGESGNISMNNAKEYTGKMRMTGGIPTDSERGINVEIEWNGNSELLLLLRK